MRENQHHPIKPWPARGKPVILALVRDAIIGTVSILILERAIRALWFPGTGAISRSPPGTRVARAVLRHPRHETRILHVT